MKEVNGRIVKAVSGFYYVELAGGQILTCKAKGIFRKENHKPLVGDFVQVECENEDTGTVSKIYERSNWFLRPPLANMTQVFVVVSTTDPSPNFLVIDKLLSMIHSKGAKAFLVITKTDLARATEIKEVYEKAKVPVFCTDIGNGEALAQLKEQLQGETSAFVGNSGVGKSTLLNRLYDTLSIETGATSEKLGRGKHTTRTVSFYKVGEQGYIADTPGFSSLDILKASDLEKEWLGQTFLEFHPFLDGCRFTGCSHTVEAGCQVLAQLHLGNIHPVRHKNYCTLYDELKEIKQWEKKK